MADRTLQLAIVAESRDATAQMREADRAFDNAAKSALTLEAAEKKLEAQFRNVEKTAKDLEQQVDRATQAKGRQTEATDRLTGVILRFASVAAIGAAIKATVEWGDRLQEASESTGISTTKLQQLTFAATQSGTTFENLITKIGMMNDRLAGGDKNAVRALQALGLSFEAIKNLGPDEQLEAIGRATEATTLSTGQLTAAFRDLFGRGGERLIPMFQELNQLMNDAPAASEQTVRALGRIADYALAMKDRLRAGFAEAITSPSTLIGGLAGNQMAGYSAKMLGAWWQASAATTTMGRSNLAGWTGAINPTGVALSGVEYDIALTQLNDAYREQTAQAKRTSVAEAALERAILSTVPAMASMAWTPWSAGGITAPMPSGYMQGWVPYSSRSLQGMAMPALPTQSYGYPVQVTNGGAGSWWSQNAGWLSGAASSVISGSMTGGVGGGVGAGVGAGASKLLSMIPGIGSFLAPLGGVIGGLFGKLFGPSKGLQEGRAADSQIKDLQAQLLATYGSLDKIREVGGETGKALAAAWGDKNVAGLEHFKKLMDDFLKQQNALQAALEKYGLTWENLGQQAKQAHLDEQAKSLVDDFKALEQAGIDVGAIYEKMAPAVSEYINLAIKHGAEIPEAMRPMIEAMQALGLLVDEAGQKFVDLGNLAWQAAQKVPDTVEIGVRWNIPEFAPHGYGGEPVPGESYHKGGYVVAHRGLAPDEVPAILQTGEGVLNRRAMRALGTGALRHLNAGGNPAGAIQIGDINIYGDVDSPSRAREMADKVAKELERRIRSGRRSSVVAVH